LDLDPDRQGGSVSGGYFIGRAGDCTVVRQMILSVRASSVIITDKSFS
jgi:hypothetical protein